MASFIFSADPNSGFSSYDDLKRQRAVALALARGAIGSTPKNVGEGLSALGRALAYRFTADRLANQEKAINGQLSSALTGILDAGATPASSAAPSAANQPGIPPEMFSTEPMTGSAPAALTGGAAKMASLSGGVPRPATSPAPGNLQSNIDVPEQYQPLITQAAKQYGVPEPLLARQLHAESSFNPNAVSPAGAQGIAQFMPATAKDMGVNAFDPASAIPGAARYLAQNYAKYGSWPLALAAYNAGPRRVDQMLASGGGMNALPAGTQGYVSKIMSGLGNLLGPTQAQAAEAPPQALAFNGTPQAAPARDAVVNALAGNQPAAPQAPLQAPPVGTFTPQTGPQPDITNLAVRPTTLPIADALAKPAPAPAPATASGGVPPNVATAARKLIATGDPRALALAGKMIEPYMTPNKFGFQALPDGTIVRTDPRTGNVTPVYRAAGEKPTSDIINYHEAQRQGYKGSFAQFQTEMKQAGRSSVTVNNAGENSFAKGLGTQTAKEINAEHVAAQDAADLIRTIHQGRTLLDQGAITGAGADWRVGALKWAGMLGIPVSQDAVNNAEAFKAVMGKAVGKIIKQFGSGTGLSDADRQYAEKIAGGSIDLNEAAIRRIMDMGEKAARGQIERWQQRVPGILKGDLSSVLSVPEPPAYTAPAAQGAAPATPAPLTSGTTQSGIKWSVH